MSSVNLLRNSRVFFSSNVQTADGLTFSKGDLKFSSHSASTTSEIQVLDDLTFSQTTAVETIGLNETGDTPLRGQRTFNTALNPVDFSFTTYIRPSRETAQGVVTSLTATFTPAGGSAITLLVSNDDTALQASTAYAPATFSTSTQFIVTAPSPTGTPATLTPVFKTTGADAGRLLGFKIASGGSGYASGGTLDVIVIDPDSAAETAGTWNFTVSTVNQPVDSTQTNVVDCEEAVLWNAMFSDALKGAGAWKSTGSTATGIPAIVELDQSNKHQLQRFALIVIFDSNTFVLHDCSLNTATIDFGIDAIASIQWSGQARRVERVESPSISTSNVISGSTGLSGSNATWSGSVKPKITSAPFIANKLSSVELVQKIGTMGTTSPYAFAPETSGSPQAYLLPLTGGSITISNNITYLTPAYMGSINQPVTYFTGSRSISGSLSAYLRSGTTTISGATYKYSAGLFQDLVNSITTDSDPEFALQINIGGSSAVPRVSLEMPGTVLSIPTVNAEQVITTTVNFTAQSTDSQKFDITKNNEIRIKYYAPASA